MSEQPAGLPEKLAKQAARARSQAKAVRAQSVRVTRKVAETEDVVADTLAGLASEHPEHAGRSAPVNEYPVIALSCSAGGLEALVTVLAPLPADLPAAVLVLQHLQPDAASQLPVLLGRSTALPVKWAEDGDALLPGCVLVAPVGRHTLITKDQTIALIPSGSVPPYRPSADLLLTTLALAAGRRVVAVVLSGEGQDAATGGTAVHRFGGFVIVSSPETSARKAMPCATMIRDEITDHVVPVEELAGMLLALTTAPVLEPSSGG